MEIPFSLKDKRLGTPFQDKQSFYIKVGITPHTMKNHCEMEVFRMGKDRQEKKLRESGRVESDRDQDLKYSGAAKMESPDEARARNHQDQ